MAKQTTQLLYKPGQLAKLIGSCHSTLLNWEREGKLVASRTELGDRYYTAEQVEQAKKLVAPWLR